MSARAFVGTGDNVLIGGFVIVGTDQKTVLLRARGPALASAGVKGVLGDPTMTLFSGQTILQSNDNWQTHENQNLIPENLKPVDPEESAILTTLIPGAYTVIVSGVNQEQGIGLVEVFEIDETGNSKLINLAARSFISVDDNILISGLIISGDEKRRILLRAKGPSLEQEGVDRVIANPQLTVLSGQEIIASNNDWESDTRASEIPNYLRPLNPLEAVVFLDLDPGAYTAIVSDTNQLSGIGIVEVFDLGPVVPSAQIIDDVKTTTEDILISIDVLENDSNIDSSSLSVSRNPQSGISSVVSGNVDYTPTTGFSGIDNFQYTVNDTAGIPYTGEVNITVNPFVATNLSISSLSIPETNYTQLNNSERNADILTSPATTLVIPDNTVSYSITLQGNDVANEGQNLFITGLVNPDGSGPDPIVKEVVFCDLGLCSALVPRKPSIKADTGNWQYSLGTLESTLNDINFSDMSLDIVVRTGPEPNLDANFPGTLKVKPFLSASTISEEELTLVMDEFNRIAIANKIKLIIDPITILSDPRFEEVDSDFEDVITAELVTMGDADKLNLFFLESFSGFNGSSLLGISGGLPGTLGIKGKFNGILINATATRGGGASDDFYARTTAETTFHEIGHFLGLYHTSEKLFGTYDVIDDTPECEEAIHDTDEDGVADFDECPDAQNIMFWNTDFLTPKELMSDDQKTTIYFSPIASP